jgi:hypothetical protein
LTFAAQAESVTSSQIRELSAVGITVACSDPAASEKPGIHSFTDVNCTYAEWLNTIAGDSVLIRPGFYVFGVGNRADSGDDLAAACLAVPASISVEPASNLTTLS